MLFNPLVCDFVMTSLEVSGVRKVGNSALKKNWLLFTKTGHAPRSLFLNYVQWSLFHQEICQYLKTFLIVYNVSGVRGIVVKWTSLPWIENKDVTKCSIIHRMAPRKQHYLTQNIQYASVEESGPKQETLQISCTCTL